MRVVEELRPRLSSWSKLLPSSLAEATSLFLGVLSRDREGFAPMRGPGRTPDSHSNSQTLKLAAFHEPFHEPAEIKDQMQKLLAHLHLGQDELRAEIEMGQDHS